MGEILTAIARGPDGIDGWLDDYAADRRSRAAEDAGWVAPGTGGSHAEGRAHI